MITPCEPDAHTTPTRAVRGLSTVLTPRRFVSIPLVCTFHQCTCARPSPGNRSRRVTERRVFAVIARSFVLSCRKILKYSPAFHDEDHAANSSNILQRVAIERD